MYRFDTAVVRRVEAHGIGPTPVATIEFGKLFAVANTSLAKYRRTRDRWWPGRLHRCNTSRGTRLPSRASRERAPSALSHRRVAAAGESADSRAPWCRR